MNNRKTVTVSKWQTMLILMILASFVGLGVGNVAFQLRRANEALEQNRQQLEQLNKE